MRKRGQPFSVRLFEDLEKEVKKLADEENRSVNAQCVTLIQEGLKARTDARQEGPRA